MKFNGKEYFNICKILNSKLSKEEADLIKNVIENLSKDKEDLKDSCIRLIENFDDLKKIINKI
jgi:hypothetical protein